MTIGFREDSGNNSTTELESIIAPVPWLEQFEVGCGVDAITGGATGSALVSTQTQPSKTKSGGASYRTVRDEKSLNQEIEVAAKGSYNIDGVTLEASSKYLNKLEYSAVSFSIVAEWEEHSVDYEEVIQPKLTEAASQLAASNPHEFRTRYGDYFVAGVRNGSSLVAVYQCKATSEENLNAFYAKVGANIPALFSVEGSTEFEQATKQYHIDVQSHIAVYGYVGALPSWPNSPAGVLDALDWLQKHVQPATLEARLVHYSNICPTLSRSINVGPDVFVNLRLLYLQTWNIRAAFNSLPSYYQEKLQASYITFDSGVTAHQSEFATDGALREHYMDVADSLAMDMRDILARESFYFKALLKVSTEPPKDETIEEKADGLHAWSYGFSSYPQNDAVTIHEIHLKFKQGSAAGYRTKTLELKPDASRLIVGWAVYANWQDGTDGWWKKVSNSILMTDRGGVYISSRWGRGCDWEVVFYYVDAEDYQFQESVNHESIDEIRAVG